jgi:alkylhydroperoxidase family enzyme
VSEEKFARLAQYASDPAFSPIERLALSYADAMTRSGQDVSDEMFAALRAQFSDEEIVELTAHVAFENFRSRLNHALRIEAQGFCLLPRS